MKNYLEKLTQKEQMEILKVIQRQRLTIKSNGEDAKIWNNALTNIVDVLYGHK